MSLFQPKARQRRQDAHIVFSTPEGKRILHWLMERYHVFDPVSGPVEEGERRVVLSLMNLVGLSAGEVEFIYRERLEQSIETVADAARP